VPDEEVMYRNEAGAELVSNAQRFVSRLAASRFLGYLKGRPQLPEFLDPQSEPDASVAADRDPAEIVPEYQAFLAQQPGWQAR
jgi:hypothetical protein